MTSCVLGPRPSRPRFACWIENEVQATSRVCANEESGMMAIDFLGAGEILAR